MEINYANRITKDIYFITTTVIDWIDIFTRPVYKHIIVDSLKYCQNDKGLELYAWVLMSNHLHLIAGTRDGIKISDFMRDFKKFTSKAIINAVKTENESRADWMLFRFMEAGRSHKKNIYSKFWQDDYDETQVYYVDFLQQKLDYIHMNPVRAEIVTEPHHYLYSSAMNYAGEKGLLDVMFI